MTAKDFLVELSAQSKLELDNVSIFPLCRKESKFIGDVKLFALAKKFIQMPLKEIGKLLMSEYRGENGCSEHYGF
jgi:hypothetical protein